jgi:hypothetical protein
MPSPKPLSVATAVPPYCFAQRGIAAAARTLFAGRFEPVGWRDANDASLDGAVEQGSCVALSRAP